MKRSALVRCYENEITQIESPVTIDKSKEAKAEKLQTKPYRSVITNPFFLYMLLACTLFGLISLHFLILPVTGALAIAAVPIAGQFFRRHGKKMLEDGPNRLERKLAEEVEAFNHRVDFFNFYLSGHRRGHVSNKEILELYERLERQKYKLDKKIGIYQWLLSKPDGAYADCIGELADCADLDDLDERLTELGNFKERLAQEEDTQKDLSTTTPPRQLKR